MNIVFHTNLDLNKYINILNSAYAIKSSSEKRIPCIGERIQFNTHPNKFFELEVVSVRTKVNCTYTSDTELVGDITYEIELHIPSKLFKSISEWEEYLELLVNLNQ